MDDAQENAPTASLVQAAVRVSQLEAELEAASDVTTAGASLVRARAILHHWVDTVTGVVATPGVGRLVLIHGNGSESRIASPELPMLLAEPISWD
jgi:hypothetical protein